MTIKNKIKELRVSKGWTQEVMAEKMGISTNGYSRLERGKGKLDWEKLQQIAAIFQVDLAQLIEADKQGWVIQQTVSFCNETENYTVQDNNKNYGTAQDLVSEIEKRDLIITHQKEMIEQKERQIRVLETLVASLQLQLEKK